MKVCLVFLAVVLGTAMSYTVEVGPGDLAGPGLIGTPDITQDLGASRDTRSGGYNAGATVGNIIGSILGMIGRKRRDVAPPAVPLVAPSADIPPVDNTQEEQELGEVLSVPLYLRCGPFNVLACFFPQAFIV